MHENTVSTPFIGVLGRKFCAWCLQPVKYDSWYEDSYYHCEANYCDCESAIRWVGLKKIAETAAADLKKYEDSEYLNGNNCSKKEFQLWEA